MAVGNVFISYKMLIKCQLFSSVRGFLLCLPWACPAAQARYLPHVCSVHTRMACACGVSHLPQPYSPGNKKFGKDVTKRYLIVSKYLMGIFFLCFAGHPLAPPNEQDLQFFFRHLFTQSLQLEAREPFLGWFNKWCFFPPMQSHSTWSTFLFLWNNICASSFMFKPKIFHYLGHEINAKNLKKPRENFP